MRKRYWAFAISFCCAFIATSPTQAREIALTFDDAPTPDSALMTGAERTRNIIAALKAAKVPDVLFFVKADYITPQTADRLKQYADAGFHLANHSFSHQSASQIDVQAYIDDALKAKLALKPFKNVLHFHRFPFLHYGKDLVEINQLQDLLTEQGYKDGYVTIDNFDWYISYLITKAAEENKEINYEKARDFYVNSLYDSIEFYDVIAEKSLKRSPRHVLLLHENDAAALFVGDLIKLLRSKGWKIISPQRAYTDPIAKNFPQVAFHKQGRVAAIANSKGFPEVELRHPSENEQYLDQAFEKAGVIINQQNN
jgi:peptidoglycan/xylan/chitin deacetylase (PgdA/CDA1 family)